MSTPQIPTARPKPAGPPRDPIASAEYVARIMRQSLLQRAGDNAITVLRDIAEMYAQKLDLTADQLLAAALKGKLNAKLFDKRVDETA